MRRSSLPPFRASKFKPQDLNLRDGERLIRCPECQSWHGLKRNMIWPHHLDSETRGGRGTRCPGSARKVIMDVDVEQWGKDLTEGEQDANARRAKRQFYKPLPATPEPVFRLRRTARPPATRSQPGSLKTRYELACHAVALHRVACIGCRRGEYCAALQELAERRAHTRATFDLERQKQARLRQIEQAGERRRAEQRARGREAQWRRVDAAVQRTDRFRKEQV